MSAPNTNGMDDAYSDQSVVVPRGAFAIFVWPDGHCEFVVPEFEDKSKVPDPFLAATMVAIKFLRDSEWVKELANEFKDAKRS
jgi:hypothetical protein